MTDRIALGLAIVILLALALDGVMNDWQATLFLGRKSADLIEYIAFWR